MICYKLLWHLAMGECACMRFHWIFLDVTDGKQGYFLNVAPTGEQPSFYCAFSTACTLETK